MFYNVLVVNFESRSSDSQIRCVSCCLVPARDSRFFLSAIDENDHPMSSAEILTGRLCLFDPDDELTVILSSFSVSVLFGCFETKSDSSLAAEAAVDFCEIKWFMSFF